MGMRKTDYEVVANSIRTQYGLLLHEVTIHKGVVYGGVGLVGIETLDRLVDDLAVSFKRDNVRFIRDRFVDAATPTWHRAERGLAPAEPRSIGRVSAKRPRPTGF